MEKENQEVFDGTELEALSYAQQTYGADGRGMVNLVREIEDEEVAEDLMVRVRLTGYSKTFPSTEEIREALVRTLEEFDIEAEIELFGINDPSQ